MSRFELAPRPKEVSSGSNGTPVEVRTGRPAEIPSGNGKNGAPDVQRIVTDGRPSTFGVNGQRTAGVDNGRTDGQSPDGVWTFEQVEQHVYDSSLAALEGQIRALHNGETYAPFGIVKTQQELEEGVEVQVLYGLLGAGVHIGKDPEGIKDDVMEMQSRLPNDKCKQVVWERLEDGLGSERSPFRKK